MQGNVHKAVRLAVVHNSKKPLFTNKGQFKWIVVHFYNEIPCGYKMVLYLCIYCTLYTYNIIYCIKYIQGASYKVGVAEKLILKIYAHRKK